MKRRGRKSAAQTPALKSERIYGSKKNPKGSASSEKSAKQITLSEKTIKALQNKLAEFKKSHTNKNITLNDLKAVYRRGSGAFSSSHRPNIPRNAWAMARVNKFLKKASGQKVKAAYVQDDDLMKYENGGETNEKIAFIDNGQANFGEPKVDFKNIPLIHETSIANSKSILKNGFRFPSNEIITKGVYSIPLAWKKEMFNENYVELVIRLKPKSKIFWTNSKSPSDFFVGYGNKFYEKLYNELNDSKFKLSSKEQGVFCRKIEKWLKENNYCGIQQGGEIVITNFDCIESIQLNNYAKAGLIAPNGKPSNLTPEQYKLVRTPEFKKWFGDWENAPENASKVVDENGEPLVVYHGSPKRNIKIFKGTEPDKIIWDAKYPSNAIFFTSSKYRVNNYGQFVKPYFLKGMNGEHYKVEDTNGISEQYLDKNEFVYKNRKGDFIRADGYDKGEPNRSGHFPILPIFHPEATEDNPILVSTYVVFSPEQIKIADGSNTTFDTNNPDIRFANGGELEKVVRTPAFKNKVFVHETDAKPFDKFDLNKVGSGQGDQWLGRGIYLQEKNSFKIEKYGKNKVETTLKPNANIFKVKEKKTDGKYRDNFVEWAVENTEVGKRKAQEIIDNGWWLYNLLPRDILKSSEAVEKLKEQGYDGLYQDGELVIYNPDVLQIKKFYDTTKYAEGGEYNDGGLIAPNGKPSNLTPEQYKIVRTPQFKAWFGDWENDPKNASKVVDENGEPLVVYHGSRSKFNIFDLQKGGQSNTISQVGFWFTPIRDFATKFARDIWYGDEYFTIKSDKKIKSFVLTYATFLCIKNPKIYETSTDSNVRYPDSYQIYRTDIYKFAGQTDEEANLAGLGMSLRNAKETIEKYRESLNSEGYDGIIIKNTRFDKTEAGGLNTQYVALYPEEIKLAEGSFSSDWVTNTTFDPNNPDIRYAKGGKTSMKKIEGKGDCYYIAGQFAMDNIFTPKKIDYIGTPYLIHAEVQGQGAISHIRYGHAWIEDDENVYDFSNGRELVIPKVLYYAIADVNTDNPSKYRKYTFAEARRKMLDTGVYGCWDLDVEYREGGEVYAESLKKYNAGGLIAPNGKPSNLTPKQYKLVRTPQFKAWFGDWENDPKNASKVVDDNGEPLVLLRGNIQKQEELGYVFQLSNNFLKKEQGNNFGFFFTDKIDVAKKYMDVNHWDEVVGGSLTSVFIKSDNIFDFREFTDRYTLKIGQDEFVNELIKKGIKFENQELIDKILNFDSKTYNYWGFNTFDYFDVFPELRMVFLKNGYTSVIFWEHSRHHTKYNVYVAFEPNQIKLADGINTTFDANSPDIRYDKGGKTKGFPIAPNGKETNLSAEQYKLVRTSEFKAWFGDWEKDPKNASKVVDENGEPLLVYHGTLNDFNVFNTQPSGEMGSHFGTKSQAEDRLKASSKSYKVHYDSDGRKISTPNEYQYADNQYMLEGFLNIRNIEKIVDEGQWHPSVYQEIFEQMGYNTASKANPTESDILNILKNKKIDGFVYKNIYEGGMPSNSYIIFNPNQFKIFKKVKKDKVEKKGEYNGLPYTETDYVEVESQKRTSKDFTEDDNMWLKKGGRIWNDAELLKRYKRGESIGFSGIAHLKAQGLIKRADGTKRKSMAYGGDIIPEVQFTPAEHDLFNIYDMQQIIKSQQKTFENGGTLNNIRIILVPDNYEKIKNDMFTLNGKGNPRLALLEDDVVIGGVFIDANEDECEFDICVKDEHRFKGYSTLLINALIKDFHENIDSEMLVCDNKLLNWEDGCFTKSQVRDFMKTNRYNYKNYLNEKSPMVKDEFKNSNGDVKCVNCGWEWNTAQSDEHDKYVCHQCGFDNTLFYDTNIMSRLKKPMSVPQISLKHNVDEEYVLEQLKKGMQHEMEHTDDEQVAEIIALHHIAERPDYYEVIEEMKLYNGGNVESEEEIENMEYDIPEYIQNERDFAERLMNSNETRISKAMICKAKINMATENERMVKSGEEQNAWSEVADIWKNCFYDVLSGDVVEYEEKECGCGCQTTSYDKGGLAYGNSHDKGGMPLTVKSTGQSIEIEGGEGVINKRSMQMNKKLEFEGKEMTPCEIISKINEMGGGVKFKCADVKKIIAEDGNY